MKINIYRNYRFIDKDPIIDAMRTVIRDELGFNNNRVQAISGVSNTTFHNWFEGATRCPQNATVSQTAAALGYVRRDEMTKDGQVVVGFVRARGTKLDYEKEIEKQADWLIQQGKSKKKRPARKNSGGSK
jgi:hypothetical protein